MRTLPLPGCWYADATPGGDYAAAVFGLPIVRTSHGDVTGREVQWLRIHPDGRQFAATGAQDASAWAWDGQHWHPQGAFVGPRAVLYRPDGSLYVERVGGWPGPGSQGWRYVDDAGRMVPSWETYDSLSAQHVWEHTTRRDVTIGQGPGGVVALVGGHRKRLDRLFALGDAPACYAVNFTRQGDDYAVAWYVAHSPVSYTACLLWLTDAELRALPDETSPQPDPQPEPEPEPAPMYAPILSYPQIVQQVWDRCTPEQRAKHAFVAEAVAWELRQQKKPAYFKPDGASVHTWMVNQKRGTQGDSEDAISIAHPQGAGGWAIVDVVAGMGGPNPSPTWIDQTQVTIDHGTVGGGREPRNVLGAEPEPEPQPKPDPVPDLIVRVKALESDVAALTVELAENVATLDAHRQALDLIAQKLDALAPLTLQEIAHGLEIEKAALTIRPHGHGLKVRG
jgi:hypothetical protein